ncbi:MAG TPA: hypothetical protein PLH46_05990 [Caldisericia bacterium]|nr:hypothetical protein [Caldisericia bacterium]
MNLTVLIEAKYIPNGSKVYKASGTYPSILKDKISVYNESGKSESIVTNGCKFLISDTGNINAISENLILKWETDLHTLNCLFGEDVDDV